LIESSHWCNGIVVHNETGNRKSLKKEVKVQSK
jgi:hypothetical protein